MVEIVRSGSSGPSREEKRDGQNHVEIEKGRNKIIWNWIRFLVDLMKIAGLKTHERNYA